ncbi:DEAD/DEAH box helicase [Actinoallomurus purpureus]|uniref:DEAD/DEAH box helicase n=1 Tax=Actinoallomurus purpureus TaxID=478114 RepID=UPI00209373C3|nr:DEAD/DEAH box helicase [Actinoallomurus purpureus]MCO6007542.1 DEAD/DEAH box helicase [Actinoallomurus purpureus]
MLVAHATWHGGALCLWAEDSALPPTTRVRTSPKPHPFATSDFSGTSYAAVTHGAPRIEPTLLLPGAATGPFPSPELAREPSSRRPKPHPWRVPALVLDPLSAMTLLHLATDSEDVVRGADLRFFAHVAEEAVHLASRGRVLPALAREDGDVTARWRPVITGDDAARFRELATAMPPACRAADEGRPASDVLLDALSGLVDAAARGVVPHPLLPERMGRVPDRLPLAERWAAALTGPDPTVSREPGDDPDALAAELDAWAAAARRSTGPLRVCFRLVEPPAPDDETTEQRPWTVEFAVQGTEDPSLYVPAAALWTGEVTSVPNAEETLLTGLGRALRLYPDVAQALRVATPTSVTTDAEGAFRFLRESAPLLSAAGFGVQLPQWAGRARLGMKLTTRTQTTTEAGAATSSGFGLSDLVDFRWDLAIDGEDVTEEELAELARLKAPLVRLRGKWVELDEKQLASAIDFLKQRRTGEMTAAQAVRAAIHAGDDALPLLRIDADGALGDLLSGEADRRLEPMSTPDDFEGTLRPYQERGLAWLSFLDGLGLGAILADDMGLGKTAQTLALMTNRTSGPTLLIGPMSLVGNWQREAARFTPKLRIYVHHGGGRHRGEDLAKAAAEADLVLTTYGTAARDHEALAEIAWDRVICDEAQALKNSGTRQARAVRSIPARSRIALTGTPVENHLTELWSIMEFANPGMLGPRQAFRERFAVPIEAYADEEAAAALHRATGPFILRRLKTDKSIITDLPEKQEIKVWCNLTPEQASLYQATVEDMLEQIAGSEGIERRGLVLATMAKLKQVCNHPAHLLKDGSRLPGRSGKLERLEEICAEVVEQGEKALVFTQYAEFGAMLRPHLETKLDRPVLWLHGGVSKKQRDELIRRFQEDSDPAIFLLSLKAAGTGLNLTAANHVVHVDRWWNPAVEDQATDRAFRIGQTKNVQVRKFICVGTIEERVDEMIERKKALAERIVGTGESWLTELSVADLREIIRLDPEAVSD